MLPFLTAALAGGEWSASRPCRLTPGGNSPQYPLDRRLGGPQSRSGCYKEEKNILPLLGIELRILCRPPHSLNTKPTALSFPELADLAAPRAALAGVQPFRLSASPP
jgi:hypothetical protein